MSLSVSNLSFSYGPKPALTGVGFDLPQGTFAALLGPNGAGKSTLFALLTRLFAAPEGGISIAGQDLARAPLSALARLGVVFQQPTLDPDLTARQNLLYFAALHGLKPPEAETRALQALDRLGMAERANEPTRALNGGHRRRMEIARALIHRPSVLILDEPTVGLDAASRRAIVDHAHHLAAKDGITVLWATHLTDEVRDSDRLLILHQGRILADATAAEIAKGAPLADRFLALTGQPA